jgi:hypothetical protein
MNLISFPQEKIFHCFLFFICLSFAARAEVCTAIVNNGNWSAGTTWSCGHVPANNDTMWVPTGFTVNVDINTPTYANMLVIVDGTLFYNVGQKINICPGGVFLSSTGMFTGGVGGSKINICGTTEWNGPGPTGGPASFGSVTLPVELTSFEGVQKNNTIALSWTTQTETNNDYFTVERSTNGLTFEEIGRVNGSGTSSQAHNYSFNDESPIVGTNYYRLKQTDFNGQFETFEIIAVELGSTTPGCVLSVYPNPCESNCTVTLSDCPNDNNGNIAVEVIDASGKTVSSTIPQRNAQGGFSYTLDVNDNLKPGVYIIRGTSSKAVYQQKAVLK